jgi:hypothetical protein
MLLVRAKYPSYISMLLVQVPFPWLHVSVSMSMSLSRISLLHHAVCPWCMSMLHEMLHEHWTCCVNTTMMVTDMGTDERFYR